MKRSYWAVSVLCLVFGLAAFGQQARPGGGPPPHPPTSTAAPAPAPTATVSPEAALQENLQEILEEPESPDSYRYDPQGRRDPFRSLVGPSPKVSRENLPAGPPGFLIDEMKLTGIVKARQGLAAMIKGPDNSGYLLHVGDKVFDGEVIRITPISIVFRQEVNDPTRIERYREVVKELAPQGGKGIKK